MFSISVCLPTALMSWCISSHHILRTAKKQNTVPRWWWHKFGYLTPLLTQLSRMVFFFYSFCVNYICFVHLLMFMTQKVELISLLVQHPECSFWSLRKPRPSQGLCRPINPGVAWIEGVFVPWVTINTTLLCIYASSLESCLMKCSFLTGKSSNACS